MTEIIRYNTIDLHKINYTKPSNQQNSYYGSIDYDNKVFNIQTARLKVKSIKDKSIIVTVDPNDFSFYDTIVKLDDHTLASTYKKSKEWFQKELPMDILESMYRRISKPFKKGDIPELEFKLSPKYKCQVYDQSNKEIMISDLVEGTTIMSIINIRGLKFLKRDYYCECYLSQIKVSQPIKESVFTGCLIEDDENNQPNKYDYEIFDEEVIQNLEKKRELQQKIIIIEQTIKNEQQELESLQQKLRSLN